MTEQVLPINATHKKMLSFIAIGIFNTLFNLVIFDVLVFVLHMGDLWANFISLVISVTISYFLNKFFAFKDDKRVRGTQAVSFIIGTFVIQLTTQHLAVWLLGERYTFMGAAFYSVLHALNVPLSKTFVVLNVAKGLGTAVSLVVSYLFYDKYVFKKTAEVE